MTTAQVSPTYAPEDPSLPKPWIGLVDGSTGTLYYWNPETNATQYDKPTSLPPPASTPNLAPIPAAHSQTANNITQHEMVHQMHHQQSFQQMPNQQGLNVPAQQAQHMPSQQSQHVPTQQTLHMPTQQAQHMPSQHSQHLPTQQAQHVPTQQTQHMPSQQAQHVPTQPTQYMPSQTQHMPNQQSQQYSFMQMNHMAHQQHPQVNEPVMTHYQSQHVNSHYQGQQGTHHGQQDGLPMERELRRQLGDSEGFTAPTFQHASGPAGDNQFPGPASHVSQVADYSVHPDQQSGRPPYSAKSHAGGAFSELPQVGADGIQRQQLQYGPSVLNHTGHTMNRPNIGQKMDYSEDPQGRGRNEYFSPSSKEQLMVHQQQLKLPTTRVGNQQDFRMGGIDQPISSGHPSSFNMASEIAMSKIRDRPAFPNIAPRGPSPRTFGSSDFASIPSVDSYLQKHEISVMGDSVPPPLMTFEATGFPPEILREVHSAGFSAPTPIQAQTWPIALQSRDIVAIAKTGSGKTLGYLIPAFLHLKQCRNNPLIGPTVLVLSPTRELATQIQDEAMKFGRSSRILCTCLYGGAPKVPQIREIERGVDIVVATPGRLNDILEMKKINFSQVSFLVLDEADRMLDMGFEPQIRKIVSEIPPRRQTLMYTATWPKEVRKIAADLLVNPVQVNIGNVDELAANKSITQFVEVVPPMEKQRRVEQILRTQERGSKIIIFCSTKRLCDQIARSLRGLGAAAIHGDKNQSERDHTLNQFRSGKTPILVATDVAARGLDIKDIRVVINYDFPNGVEDYVHRIGRTGRAGASGIAYTFISDQDWKHAAELVKVLEGANQRVPPQVREMAARGASYFPRGGGRGGATRWDSGGGRLPPRDEIGFGGRGGRDLGGARGGGFRDNNGGGFGGRGRNDFPGGARGGRGGRGYERGPSGGGGGRGGWQDRGISGGRGGRFDGPPRRNNNVDRRRDRSYSRSPDRGRSNGYSSDSRSRSRSYSRSRSRSRSPSYERPARARRPSGFDAPLTAANAPVLPPPSMEPSLPGNGDGAAEPGGAVPDLQAAEMQ